MRFPRARFPAFILKAGLCIGLMVQTISGRSYLVAVRALVLITGLTLLSACSTPIAAPSVIILAQDMNFKWVPPNLGRRMEVSIPAGRYTQTDSDSDVVYYESERALVSRAYIGQSADKTKGGIGYLKREGRYFVWEFAPSIIAQTAWGLISGQTQEGPLVRIYLGKVPKENEPSLQFEK